MRRISVLVVAATIASVACVDVWWESAVIYQIYLRSFKDSNGDGIGDLNGITQKLPYLKYTGIDAIRLSPMFVSPMVAFGYDIKDYRQIAPEYGTMEDFHNLVAEAKKMDIRVILDFVPNHTSNESEWFVKSARRDPNYLYYYIWADGKPDPKDPYQMTAPSNWITIFRKSAWEYNEVRQQYYLHQFVTGQPDLNYRNKKVREEIKNAFRFWLDKGVSGFHLDAVNMLFEVNPIEFDGHYPDEPVSGAIIPEDYAYLNHVYTRDQDETYDLIYDWRVFLDEYTSKHNESKIMMTEAYTTFPRIMRYYGNNGRNGSIPFNFFYTKKLTKGSNAKNIKMVIDKWMTYMPGGKTANWVNSNHDQSRLATRYGVDKVDAMNMLALLLPGITITYQGEELGMTDGRVSWKDTKDPQACNTGDPKTYWKSSRDPARTPFHWDPTTNAGFTAGKSTWLPVADNYKTVNLAAQLAADKSHYKFYRDVVMLKHLPVVRFGDSDVRALSDSVLVVTRMLPGYPAVLGIMNLSNTEQSVDLTSLRLLPQKLRVEASGVNCTLKKGFQLDKNSKSMYISAHCAIALTSTQNCCTSKTNRKKYGNENKSSKKDIFLPSW